MLSKETADSCCSTIFPAYPYSFCDRTVFQFLIVLQEFYSCEMVHIILKLNIMKSYYRKNSKKELNEQTNLWDAFVNYLDTNYFPGASETLDTKTIAFEYEAFKSCYA